MRDRSESTRKALLERLLVATSRTFALSIPALPPPTRSEVTVAYLLFRIADTLEDATAWRPVRKLQALGRFAELLRGPSADEASRTAAAWLEAPPLDDPGYLELLSEMPTVLEAFEDLSAEAREIVRLHTIRTVERMASFVRRDGDDEGLRLADVADLQAYCYAVAGIVGEMLTELFVLGRDELRPAASALRSEAARFGEALQLVNILKDADADAVEGRRYLPDGVDRAAVFTLAREDLAGAARYVDALQEAGTQRGLVEFTALPVLLARETLELVERQGSGAKLTRPDVLRIVQGLEAALDRRESAVPAIPGERHGA